METLDFVGSVKQLLHNDVPAEYSKAQVEEKLRERLIELSGYAKGSRLSGLKNMYRGSELFELVQELLPILIEEGLKNDDFFNGLVEYRNIADGDLNEFIVEPDYYFIVSNNATGIRDVRRQKVDTLETLQIPTKTKTVRIYEELYRLMSGRIDWNQLTQRVAASFEKSILEDAYYAVESIGADTKGLNSNYVATGSKGEKDALLELISHVEAATGKQAALYGTAASFRNLFGDEIEYADSERAKGDLYDFGYIGKFYGTPLYTIRQAHKTGTDEFIISDKKIFVIAGDDKPVKVVDEGEGILYESEAINQADLTQEYVYGQKTGIGVVCCQKMGIYTIVDSEGGGYTEPDDTELDDENP